MVTCRLVEEGDLESVALDGGDIEVVSEFPYLGSLISDSGMWMWTGKWPKHQRLLVL